MTMGRMKRILGFSDVKQVVPGIRAAIAEAIATFFIVFIGCGCLLSFVSRENNLVPSLGFGLATAAGVAMTDEVSGSHLNPAISLGYFLLGRTSLFQAVINMIGQLSGGIGMILKRHNFDHYIINSGLILGGAFLLKLVTPRIHQGNLGANRLYSGVVHPDCDDREDVDNCILGAVGVYQGFGIEVVISLVLALVMFATSDTKRRTGFVFAPVAIGLTVTGCHLLAIPFTRCSLNPARTLGPALASGEWDNQVIFWLGPLTGGVLGAFLYFLVFSPSKWGKRSNTRGEYDVTLQFEEGEKMIQVT